VLEVVGSSSGSNLDHMSLGGKDCPLEFVVNAAGSNSGGSGKPGIMNVGWIDNPGGATPFSLITKTKGIGKF